MTPFLHVSPVMNTSAPLLLELLLFHFLFGNMTWNPQPQFYNRHLPLCQGLVSFWKFLKEFINEFRFQQLSLSLESWSCKPFLNVHRFLFFVSLFSITFQICLIASCALWFDDTARRWWKEGKPDNIVPSCWPANSGVPPAHHDARYCCLIVDGIWKMGSSCRVYWDYSEDTFRFSSQSQLRGGLYFRCPKNLAFAFSTQKNSRVSIIIEKLLQIGLKT